MAFDGAPAINQEEVMIDADIPMFIPVNDLNQGLPSPSPYWTTPIDWYEGLPAYMNPMTGQHITSELVQTLMEPLYHIKNNQEKHTLSRMKAASTNFGFYRSDLVGWKSGLGTTTEEGGREVMWTDTSNSVVIDYDSPLMEYFRIHRPGTISNMVPYDAPSEAYASYTVYSSSWVNNNTWETHDDETCHTPVDNYALKAMVQTAVSAHTKARHEALYIPWHTHDPSPMTDLMTRPVPIDLTILCDDDPKYDTASVKLTSTMPFKREESGVPIPDSEMSNHTITTEDSGGTTYNTIVRKVEAQSMAFTPSFRHVVWQEGEFPFHHGYDIQVTDPVREFIFMRVPTVRIHPLPPPANPILWYDALKYVIRHPSDDTIWFAPPTLLVKYLQKWTSQRSNQSEAINFGLILAHIPLCKPELIIHIIGMMVPMDHPLIHDPDILPDSDRPITVHRERVNHVASYVKEAGNDNVYFADTIRS